MNKSSGSILVLLTGAVLMAYTMFRSVHLVQSTLPQDSQIMGYAALFGLDAALIAWTIYKARSARGDKQHAIAMFMVILQLFGIGGTLIADTWLVADPENAPDVIQIIALWVVPLIIATNVAAITSAHLCDPAAEIRNAQRDLEDELERQVADHLRQNKGKIASNVTQAAADHRAAEMLAQFMRERGNGGLQLHGGNGHKADAILAAEGSEPPQVQPKSGRRKRPVTGNE